jgi:hypothetical protein
MITVTILGVTDNIDAAVLKKMAAVLAPCADDGQIVGELVTEETASTLINPKRASHLIRNVRYNAITESVMVNIQLIRTPYGVQLEKILKERPESIEWQPVFSYDDTDDEIRGIQFVTVRALYKKE